jgi:hypothetical protein
VLSLTGAQTLEKFAGGKDGYFTTDRRKADQLVDFALTPPSEGQDSRADLENILHPMASKVSLTAGRWINVAISAPLTAVANRIFGAATHDYDAALAGSTQA